MVRLNKETVRVLAGLAYKTGLSYDTIILASLYLALNSCREEDNDQD